MLWLLLMAFATAVCVYTVDTVERLKKSPASTGMLFGSVAVLAGCAEAAIDNVPLFSGSVLMLPVTASFFFAPVSGLIAGVMASLSCLIPFFYGPEGTLCLFAAAAVLAVSVCSYLTGKLFFADRKPGVLIFLVCAAYYGLFYFLVFFSCGYYTPDHSLRGIYKFAVPLFSGIFVSCLPVIFILRIWKKEYAGILRRHVRALFISEVCLVVLIGFALRISFQNARSAVFDGFIQTNITIRRQVNFFLRNTAIKLLDENKDLKKYSPERLRQLAGSFDLDEINIIDDNGGLVTSSNPEYMKRTDFRRHGVVDFKKGAESPVSRIPMIETEVWPVPGSSAPGEIVNTQKRTKTGLNPIDEGVIYRVAIPFRDGGYAEVGLDQYRYLRKFDATIMPLMKEWSIGTSGALLICDPKGTIAVPVYKHPELCGKNIRDFIQNAKTFSFEKKETNLISFQQVLCCCVKAEFIDGWYFYGLIPLSEFATYYLLLALLFNLTLLSFLFTAQFLRQRARQFSAKVNELRREQDEHRKSEMRMLRELQRSELCDEFSETEHTLITTYYKPMEAVGGDFYDYFSTKDGNLVFLIADVAGEGVPAAFCMIKAKMAIREIVGEKSDLGMALSLVNERLCVNNKLKQFVTLWIGILDPQTGKGQYISAGHNPPLLYRSGDGSLDWLKSPNSSLALGISPAAVYKANDILLKKNDKLFLYTDGVTEARNGEGKLFTGKWLKEILSKEENFIPRVSEALLCFTYNSRQADDITMLQILYKGASEEA